MLINVNFAHPLNHIFMNTVFSTSSAALLKYFPLVNDKELEELIEYRKDLKTLSRGGVSIQFNNKGKNHATCVMSEIFECSHSKIKILADSFNGDISDNELYLESLRKFLNKGNVSVDVVFLNNPNPNSRALKLLRNEQEKNNSNKIRIKKLTSRSTYEMMLVDPKKDMNFTLGNDPEKGFNMYRCETDTENYIAVLNFDDTLFTTMLNKMFDLLSKESAEI